MFLLERSWEETSLCGRCGWDRLFSNARIVEKSSEAKEIRTDLSLNAKTFEEVI